MVLVALAIRLAVVPFVYDEWMEPYFVDHLGAGQCLAGAAGRPRLRQSVPLQSAFGDHAAGLSADCGRNLQIFGIHTTASILAALSFNCLLLGAGLHSGLPDGAAQLRPARGPVGGLGWAFSPYGIYFSAEWAWSTHLLLLCLCWMLYLAQDLERSPKLALWAGFGLLAGFAGLTEPSILILVPFLLALAAWRLASVGKRWFLPGLVASLTLAAALSPWMIRNAVVFHRFIPMRDSMGLELWLGNNGYSRHWINADHHPNHDPKELAAYNAGELPYMAHKAQQARDYIHAHPSWYAWMCARRALYLWTGYWSFDRSYLAEEPLDPPNVAVASTLTLLGLLGIILAWKQHRFEAIRYGGVLFLFPLMYYFTHPQAYHMRPLDPLIVILGCYAIVSWRELAKARTARRRIAESAVAR
jgi:hypothetical protein